MDVGSKAQNTVLEPFKDLLTFQISLDRPDFSVFKSWALDFCTEIHENYWITVYIKLL